MEVYACGLNAHKQLESDSQTQSRGHSLQNIYNFLKVAEGGTVRIFCTLRCATILEIDGRLTHRGYDRSGLWDCNVSGPVNQKPHGIASVYGDLCGLVGGIGDDGQLLRYIEDDQRPGMLMFGRRKQEPWLQQDGSLLEHVMIAGDETVAVVTRGFSLPSTLSNISLVFPTDFYLFNYLGSLA